MEKIIIKPLIEIEEKLLRDAKNHLEKIFNLKVGNSPHFLNLDFTFNPRRNQYLASAILDEMEKFKKDFSEKWLAICDVDLYSQGLNFIFGEANINSGVSIISLTRLRQEFYGLSKDKKLFIERIKKEAVHELGHLFFLNHCQNSKCVMHFSNSLADTDEKEANFCQKCKVNLQFYLGKK